MYHLLDRPGSWEIRLEGERIAAITPSSAPARLTALPGFVESHAHLFAGGVSLGQLNLAEVHDAAALQSALSAFAETIPEGQLICAYAANYDLVGRRPTKADLDALTPRPLYIVATDYHCAWANSAALAWAGIPDHAGELHEFAEMSLVGRLAPSGGRHALGLSAEEPRQEDLETDRSFLQAAMRECLRHGITRVDNMDGNLYQARLLAGMDLPIDVSLPMTLTGDLPEVRLEALLAQACQGPQGRLSFGRVKVFMDGVFDTHTAFRTDDYPGRPGFRGAPLIEPDTFARLCIRADALGLQITTHAVGDAAVRATLDGYEAARRANGKGPTHRIEHIDLLHAHDLPRFKALDVTASMQPVHPPGLAGLPLQPTIDIMGRPRWADSFPWKALHGQTRLVFGTDWPVSPLSPLHAIHCALTRTPWDPANPDQRLTLAETLAAYTGPALREGALADIVVIEGDLSRPLTCRVVETISRGQRSAFIA